jgi:hypothetical protein
VSTRDTVTRTIRIDSRYDDVLRSVAEDRGYSVNALMDQILKRWVDATRFFETGSSVTMSNETFGLFLDLLEDEEIEELATQSGSERPRDRLMMRGRKVDFDSVLWYIKNILGEFNGWFTCQVNVNRKEHTLHLTHQRGYKWSLFAMNYVKSIFRDTLNMEPATIIFKNAVNIQLRT